MSKIALGLPPVIIVTGANGGVGYGVCQRLLLQLCQLSPSDSNPQPFASGVKSNDRPSAGYRGVTLIMACRNMTRAEAARTTLLQWLEDEIRELDKHPKNKEEEEYRRVFRASLDVQIAELDLASFSSVLKFAAGIRQKMPYVSHMVFNAGVASFNAIEFWPCVKQLVKNPMEAITAPSFYSQHSGEISADNLGWVWQSNIFGHFTLFRELEDTLAKSPFDAARVIWCSSLEASPTYYDSEDWQLIKTAHSYESSKYQIDLIATNLDQVARQSTTMKPVRHFISEPGVCSTTISAALIGPLLEKLKVIAFYMGRFFGSPHHTIDPLKAAIAAVHLMLVPLAFLSVYINNDASQPVRFGAMTRRWGEEYVGLSPVKEWNANKEEGKALIAKCDKLYEDMKAGELPPQLSVSDRK